MRQCRRAMSPFGLLFDACLDPDRLKTPMNNPRRSDGAVDEPKMETGWRAKCNGVDCTLIARQRRTGHGCSACFDRDPGESATMNDTTPQIVVHGPKRRSDTAEKSPLGARKHPLAPDSGLAAEKSSAAVKCVAARVLVGFFAPDVKRQRDGARDFCRRTGREIWSIPGRAWPAIEFTGEMRHHPCAFHRKTTLEFIASARPSEISPDNAAKGGQGPAAPVDPVCGLAFTSTAPPRNGCSPGTAGATRLPRRTGRFPVCALDGRSWVWPSSHGGQK